MAASCDRYWDDFDGEASPELIAHSAGCAECAQMLEALASETGAPLSAPPALAQAARAELVAHPAVRPWWVGPAVAGGISLAIVLALALSHASVLAPAFGVLGLPLALGMIFAFGGALWSATAPERGLLAPWMLGAIATGIASMLAACNWSGFGPPGGLSCAITEVVSSALPLGLAVWVLRQSAFSWTRTIAGVAACGGVGVLVLELGCPSPMWLHVLVAHLLPWLVTCAIAVFVRSRLPSASYAP